jgi:hypothetical protein
VCGGSIAPGGIFSHQRHSAWFGQARPKAPRLWTRHPSDPAALIFKPTLRRLSAEAAVGFWAGKLAAQPAHHCFGAWGRLPHLQVNIWRIGVKGSGSAMRLPMPMPRAVVRLATLVGLVLNLAR